MVQAVTLRLPTPPSVNASYVLVGKRRFASRKLKAWKEAAGWALQAQPKGRITGPFRISIHVPTAMRADVDNVIKAAVDLLVAHRITPDDRFAKSVSSERSDAVPLGQCLIIVEPA